jgi:iron complex outermembrane receptor protein
VDRRNEIVPADPASIVGNNPVTGGTPNAQVPGAAPGSFIYYDVDGNIGTVTGFYRNAAKTKTDGVDLELRHRMNLGSVGKLSAQLNWTHTRKLERTDADGNTFEYAGTHGKLADSSGSGSPKDRIVLSATLERGNWGVTGTLNYTGKIKMVDHKGETTPQDVDENGVPTGTITNPNTGVSYPDNGQYDCGVFTPEGNVWNGCKLPSFTTFDLYARWAPIKNLEVNFSVQNVFNKKAPFDPYLVIPYGINYNQGYHQAGAVGRFFTIGARYSF